jgi:hypothetical protein
MEQAMIKYALGAIDMLRQAIYAHAREHQGKSPRRIEVHPEVVRSILADRRIGEFLNPMKVDGFEFMGIPLIEDVLATQPKLINCKNEVIYL